MFANIRFHLPLTCALCAALTGCSDGTLPKWVTGEPTKAEIAASNGAIILPAEPVDEPYPNLADVPPRPTPTLDAKGRANEMNDLKKENESGQQAIQEYNAETKTPVSGAKK